MRRVIPPSLVGPSVNRRSFVAAGLAVLGGCLTESGPSTDDPEGTRSDDRGRNGTDDPRDRNRTDDPSTDTPVPPDAEIVAYEALSGAGQRFVDDAQDRGHELDRLSEDGERTYVRYDDEADRYVRVDDPLTLDAVDDELERVFHGDALVEREGWLYEGGMTVGHGPYKQQFSATEDPDCEDAVDAAALSEPGREIAGALAEDGTAWVSTRKFERVAEADVFVDDEAAIGAFVEAVGIPSGDGGCVDVDGRRLRVRQADQASLNHRGFHLEFVAEAE